MSWITLLTSLRPLTLRQQRRSARPARHTRPALEAFEERLAPAGIDPSATFSLQQNNLYETVQGSTSLIDTNVQSYVTGSLGGINYLFDVTNTGFAKEFDGSQWSFLTGSNTSVSLIAAVSGGLYMLAHNGGDNDTVWQYSGSGTNWTAVTGTNTNVAQIATADGCLYMLAHNGTDNDSVWAYSGSGSTWCPVTGSNTTVTQIAALGDNLYMVATNGGNNGVWRYNGFGTTSWTALTGSNTQVDQIVAADSSLYMVGGNDYVVDVWQYSGSGTNWTYLTGTALQNALSTWSLGTSHPAAGAAYSPISGTLFGSGSAGFPSYLDVQQGGLGDCWLMASLAEVAARVPAYAMAMFIFDGSTVENGAQVNVYSVRFYNSQGLAHYVTVDTELPAGGGYYAHPVNNVEWVALAEKAYAEANALGYVPTHNDGTNSYAVMGGGDPAWAL
jgi:hypothetical protein